MAVDCAVMNGDGLWSGSLHGFSGNVVFLFDGSTTRRTFSVLCSSLPFRSCYGNFEIGSSQSQQPQETCYMLFVGKMSTEPNHFSKPFLLAYRSQNLALKTRAIILLSEIHRERVVEDRRYRR